jgi:hypothetical protein
LLPALFQWLIANKLHMQAIKAAGPNIEIIAAPLIVRMARSILKPDKEKTEDLRRRMAERREQS